MANNSKIDFDKVNEYAKVLGIPAKGKKKDEFINEVLDAIVAQYTENEEGMAAKDFEAYKKENKEMLQFYMANKDYGQKPEKEVVEEPETAEGVDVDEPEDMAEEEPEEPETGGEPVVEEREEKDSVKKIESEKKKSYTRVEAFCEALKKAKKGITPKELAENADVLYVEKGGKSNSKEAVTVSGFGLRFLMGLDLIEKSQGKVVFHG